MKSTPPTCSMRTITSYNVNVAGSDERVCSVDFDDRTAVANIDNVSLEDLPIADSIARVQAILDLLHWLRDGNR